MAEDTDGLNRRTVLKNVAAAGTFAAGVAAASGSAGAAVSRQPSKVKPVEERVGDAETVERLFAEHGQPLVDALADRGYVEPSAGVSVESFVPTDEFAATDAADVATASYGRVGSTEVTDVRLRQRSGDYEIEYHVHPDGGDGYALVTALDGGDTVLVQPNAGEQDVSTQYCETGCDCDVRCTTDYCDCTVGGYIWYYQESETCHKTDDGTCLCSWERSGCDCRGEEAHACPE